MPSASLEGLSTRAVGGGRRVLHTAVRDVGRGRGPVGELRAVDRAVGEVGVLHAAVRDVGRGDRAVGRAWRRVTPFVRELGGVHRRRPATFAPVDSIVGEVGGHDLAVLEPGRIDRGERQLRGGDRTGGKLLGRDRAVGERGDADRAGGQLHGGHGAVLQVPGADGARRELARR